LNFVGVTASRANHFTTATHVGLTSAFSGNGKKQTCFFVVWTMGCLAVFVAVFDELACLAGFELEVQVFLLLFAAVSTGVHDVTISPASCFYVNLEFI
jgi:hypothetical protein